MPFDDYKIADISLSEWGDKEISMAETEMPGLMAVRDEFKDSQPLKGARIAGSLHMTIQTAVLIQTLKALGADIRWATCNIFSTQDHAAAAIAAGDTPVFALKGESLVDYWDYAHRIFEWSDGGTANMILDDGGDATLLIDLDVLGVVDEAQAAAHAIGRVGVGAVDGHGVMGDQIAGGCDDRVFKVDVVAAEILYALREAEDLAHAMRAHAATV